MDGGPQPCLKRPAACGVPVSQPEGSGDPLGKQVGRDGANHRKRDAEPAWHGRGKDLRRQIGGLWTNGERRSRHHAPVIPIERRPIRRKHVVGDAEEPGERPSLLIVTFTSGFAQALHEPFVAIDGGGDERGEDPES
jgi:hypothetical protein